LGGGVEGRVTAALFVLGSSAGDDGDGGHGGDGAALDSQVAGGAAKIGGRVESLVATALECSLWVADYGAGAAKLGGGVDDVDSTASRAYRNSAITGAWDEGVGAAAGLSGGQESGSAAHVDEVAASSWEAVNGARATRLCCCVV
jgi:hypothetical protein